MPSHQLLAPELVARGVKVFISCRTAASWISKKSEAQTAPMKLF